LENVYNAILGTLDVFFNLQDMKYYAKYIIESEETV